MCLNYVPSHFPNTAEIPQHIFLSPSRSPFKFLCVHWVQVMLSVCPWVWGCLPRHGEPTSDQFPKKSDPLPSHYQLLSFRLHLRLDPHLRLALRSRLPVCCFWRCSIHTNNQQWLILISCLALHICLSSGNISFHSVFFFIFLAMNNLDIDFLIIFPMGIIFFSIIICFFSSPSHSTSSFLGWASFPFLYVPIKYIIYFLDMSFIICIKTTFFEDAVILLSCSPSKPVSQGHCVIQLFCIPCLLVWSN